MLSENCLLSPLLMGAFGSSSPTVAVSFADWGFNFISSSGGLVFCVCPSFWPKFSCCGALQFNWHVIISSGKNQVLRRPTFPLENRGNFRAMAIRVGISKEQSEGGGKFFTEIPPRLKGGSIVGGGEKKRGHRNLSAFRIHFALVLLRQRRIKEMRNCFALPFFSLSLYRILESSSRYYTAKPCMQMLRKVLTLKA